MRSSAPGGIGQEKRERFVEEFTCGEAVVEYRCEVVEGTFGAEEGRERCRGVGGIIGQISGHDATQVGDDAGLVLGATREFRHHLVGERRRHCLQQLCGVGAVDHPPSIPSKFGSRFSAKAVIASMLAGVPISLAKAAFSRS